MIVIDKVTDLRQYVKQQRLSAVKTAGRELSVGFVPTMGFLHDGHASLLKQAREQNDLVVLSIFVNPIQFGPNEDLDRYPRDEQRDLALAAREGVDVVFLPSVQEMYPQPTKTKIAVSELTEELCGASRPGHFDGVTTVVGKLFHMVAPDTAYFGLKDAQQVAVIRQMVDDLNFDIKIVPCPIVRESDGLALSSRNVYLSEEEREQALILSRSLREAEDWIKSNPAVTTDEIRESLIRNIKSQPLAVIDYVDILAFPSLTPVHTDAAINDLDVEILIALAVKFGTTRLIDNILLTTKGVATHV
ncbi:pantoate--beta-alanine ligase [Paenibacillus sp. YPG26]|uniref:pantoate--beta-alanine ligase n=1 Tax=Paenibacillus sp. YPG26 TaxID=2878915 RepID=UPI00203DA495|nr:pantoate--beta-alanine ligase [Paenibacillus sp. YPG26]USB34800.1 pantoate--beta-alanine ligase [Paenibacillus sp. YPG26]